MASLKDLRDRIASVKATQKITRAMQMVAAAKLRRAQEAVVAARPYSARLEDVLADISVNLVKADMPALMRGRERDKVQLAVICTADRGLCGGFNAQIMRHARTFLRARQSEGKQVKIITIGKKGAEMLKREFGALFIESVEVSSYKNAGFERARAIAEDIIRRYEQQEFDVCTLFYSEFKSVINQQPQAQQLIPCGQGYETGEGGRAAGEEQADKAAQPAGRAPAFYEYEPDIAEVLEDLVLRLLSARIFRALLENAAGEMGAKMTAMDNATRNAGTMINSLSITYNRQRQARITTELIEIIAGAEAL